MLRCSLILACLAILASSGCDVSPEIDYEFSQVRVRNYSAATLTTETVDGQRAIKPGSYWDFIYEIGGQHVIRLFGRDTVSVTVDIVSKDARHTIDVGK